MQLALSALFAWLAIILFSIVPKRLSILDLVFLYCVIFILTTASYTIFDVNLRVVTISRAPSISFATILTRLVTIPVLIMMAVDALQPSEGRQPNWLTAIAIWLVLTVFDWVLDLLKIITYRNSFVWHALTTSIVYLGFIVISWGLTRWYRSSDRKNVQL
ncbi:hypothetical protein [Alicyclobacillus acidiphilus]|uniref:hypothetical protein n=1 Tax=Alicyclobacillus acidiphilus TaxID=182455 RepID=UPI00082F9BCD|nr:hypothetical protein [Alicyclobacillus acidiphilus]